MNDEVRMRNAAMTFDEEFYRMIDEGVPAEALFVKLLELGGVPANLLPLLESLRIFAQNLDEDARIPTNIVDDDGAYAQMRAYGRARAATVAEVVAKLERQLRG